MNCPALLVIHYLKIVKVHLGVDIKVIKNRTNYANQLFTIVTPAELTPRKGHIYAIDAAKKLIDMGVNDFRWFLWKWPIY